MRIIVHFNGTFDGLIYSAGGISVISRAFIKDELTKAQVFFKRVFFTDISTKVTTDCTELDLRQTKMTIQVLMA